MKTGDLVKEDSVKAEAYLDTRRTGLPARIYRVLFNRGVRSIALYRLMHRFYNKNKPLYIFFEILNSLFSPIEISPGAEIGEGLSFPHALGIVIGDCKIGKNAFIYQNVTIGLKSKMGESPVIGDNVHIGAGATILGNVKIGSNSTIGANAVVITDVPDNCMAVGIPAKVKKLEVNSDLFPDISLCKPIAAIRVEPFTITFPKALIEDTEV